MIKFTVNPICWLHCPAPGSSCSPGEWSCHTAHHQPRQVVEAWTGGVVPAVQTVAVGYPIRYWIGCCISRIVFGCRVGYQEMKQTYLKNNIQKRKLTILMLTYYPK